METRDSGFHVGVLVAGCILVLSPPSIGAEGAATLSGKVVVTKREATGPSAATFTNAQGTLYNLVMDERGRSLAGVMHNETAEVLAVPSEKDGAKWLTVLDYTDANVRAGHEFWRRMRCNACVVLPATRNAATPTDLHGATPVTGRDYSFKRKLAACAHDSRFLWAAADNQILQIDLAKQSVLRSYGKKDGLPDQLVYQLASDGKTLWIVHRAGIAALSIGAETIVDLPQLRARYARALTDADGVWIVADTGTFRLKTPGDAAAAGPPLPTAERITRAVENGIWTPHWNRRTAAFVSAATSLAGSLYVCSWGGIYRFDGGAWEKIAADGFEPCVRAGKLWFIDAKGLVEYDPGTKTCTPHEPPESCRGRCARLAVTDTAAWLVSEPLPGAGDAPPYGGGLARFDLAAGKWQTWPEINGRTARHVSALTVTAGGIWAVTMDGHYISKSAHPGMTTTKRQSLEAGSFCLQSFDEKAQTWQSFPLAPAEFGERLICGQDGSRGMDTIVPQYLEELSVGPRRIFAVSRLVPKQYFGGYWPCLEQIASRAGAEGTWSAKFEHHPEQLELQGEQPLVLNISNGELTRIGSNLKDQLWEAVGHDLVLDVFPHGDTHWAVTEGCIGFFDEAAGSWRKLMEPEFRWYWRATAGLEDGRWLYIGSDRGLLSRLDIESGQFECLGALKERSITRIAKGANGDILAASRPAPLGALPVQLAAKLAPLDADAARFDGKSLVAAKTEDLPAADAKQRWEFRYFDRKDHLDKSFGNYLCGPLPNDPEVKPRYYVKEAFYPLFLCTGAGGSRMWISTYTGMLRLDVAR